MDNKKQFPILFFSFFFSSHSHLYLRSESFEQMKLVKRIWCDDSSTVFSVVKSIKHFLESHSFIDSTLFALQSGRAVILFIQITEQTSIKQQIFSRYIINVNCELGNCVFLCVSFHFVYWPRRQTLTIWFFFFVYSCCDYST